MVSSLIHSTLYTEVLLGSGNMTVYTIDIEFPWFLLSTAERCMATSKQLYQIINHAIQIEGQRTLLM